MQTQTIIISCVFLAIIFFSHKILLFLSEKLENIKYKPIPDAYPIEYPLEPMFENYTSIIEQLEVCGNKKELYECYVRYILFASCYKDSPTFIHELHDLYSEKENKITPVKDVS